MKILLVQLAANGDCLLVTPIARQIKEVDYPGCHLTWMIGTRHKQVLLNNPYIDEIIDVPISSAEDRKKIPVFLDDLKKKGFFFDKIVVTDLIADNYKYFYCTLRTSFFRTYGKPLTVSPEPVISLLPEEVERVADFARKHGLTDGGCYPVLFECSPLSCQSTMNVEKAIKISRRVIASYPQVKFILSTKDKLPDADDHIIDGSVLSWRENAELTKYCKLLVGCSSGITWLNMSDWAAKIPTVQSISNNFMDGVISPSLEIDLMYLGLSTEKVIEFVDPEDEKLIDCICWVIKDSFAGAKKVFQERRPYSKEELTTHFAMSATQAFYDYRDILKRDFVFVFHAKTWLKRIVKKIMSGKIRR